MKNIIAAAAVAAIAALLTSTPSSAKADTSPSAEQSVQQVATHFSGQGSWVVVDSLGGKDAAEATEHAAALFGVLGLGGVALLTLIRLQAEGQARRAWQAIGH
ncbi:MAG TPA: hypothetical protein VKQ54_00740 [Caulobacteraceae bacterium]|nr:hypothetical protein [Caulobacteraceae bacterium]